MAQADTLVQMQGQPPVLGSGQASHDASTIIDGLGLELDNKEKEGIEVEEDAVEQKPDASGLPAGMSRFNFVGSLSEG